MCKNVNYLRNSRHNFEKIQMTSSKRARVCGHFVDFKTIETNNGVRKWSNMSQIVLGSNTYFYYIALHFDIYEYFNFRKSIEIS